jgi:hypothetical protein
VGTVAVIVATGARIGVMTGATGARTAATGAADPGCCGDSSMGGPTTKPMARSPLSRTTQVVHGSVTR